MSTLWVDWSGESTDGEIAAFAVAECARLGLDAPAWTERDAARVVRGAVRGEHVHRLAAGIAKAVKAVGGVMFWVGNGTDAYGFVIVPSTEAAAFRKRDSTLSRIPARWGRTKTAVHDATCPSCGGTFVWWDVRVTQAGPLSASCPHDATELYNAEGYAMPGVTANVSDDNGYRPQPRRAS